MKMIMEKTQVERVRFAQMLDELKAYEITQRDFASAIGVTEGLVSNLKAGRNALTISIAKKIESAFPKYRAAWLLGLDVSHSCNVDALSVLDSRVSALSPERRDALLECVQDFIDFNISRERV